MWYLLTTYSCHVTYFFKELVLEKIGYNLLAGNLWIQLTGDDVEKINALAEIDISTRPQGVVKVYLANQMLNCNNINCLSVLQKPNLSFVLIVKIQPEMYILKF